MDNDFHVFYNKLNNIKYVEIFLLTIFIHITIIGDVKNDAKIHHKKHGGSNK